MKPGKTNRGEGPVHLTSSLR